jgi:putative glutamine amidotransferase
LQELNVAFGGSLHQRVFDLPGHFDHRMRRDVDSAARYRVAHSIAVTEAGLLASIWGDDSSRLVNSLHAQAIDQVAPGVRVEAVSPDGIVEAISVRDAPAFALGVQWHPEWPRPLEAHNQQLFAAFGAACRARAAGRGRTAQAAE